MTKNQFQSMSFGNALTWKTLKEMEIFIPNFKPTVNSES